MFFSEADHNLCVLSFTVCHYFSVVSQLHDLIEAKSVKGSLN